MEADESIEARAHTLLQQTLLGDAAEHADVALMAWNEELRYVAINEAACRMLGASRAELLGARVGDHNPTRGQSAIEAVLHQVPAAGVTTLGNGQEVQWLVVATRVSGLPHFFGFMWPTT